MKRIITEKEIYLCDRCGEEIELEVVTNTPNKISFDVDNWEFVWDGHSYNYNVGSGGDKRVFNWKRLFKTISLELCDNCFTQLKEFWKEDYKGRQIKEEINNL